MSEIININKAITNFDEILDKVSNGQEFLIEKDGIIMGALVNAEEYLRIMHPNLETKEALRKSQKQHEEGDVGTEEDVFNNLRDTGKDK